MADFPYFLKTFSGTSFQPGQVRAFAGGGILPELKPKTDNRKPATVFL
jgi:hypothetical protein